MIILLHGDNIQASRTELIKLKEAAKGKEIRILDGRTIDQSSLVQALESRSMFSGQTAVFIENLFGKLGRKAKLIDALATILRESSADIILWEDKEVGAAVIKSLGKADVKLFPFPKVLFQFLDSLAPGNAKKSLELYRNLIVSEAPELVFFMLAARLRHLIQIADGVTPEGMQSWQVSRLTRQAKVDTMDRLLSMYKNLLDMEYQLKNGSSPFTVRQLTEQAIIDF